MQGNEEEVVQLGRFGIKTVTVLPSLSFGSLIYVQRRCDQLSRLIMSTFLPACNSLVRSKPILQRRESYKRIFRAYIQGKAWPAWNVSSLIVCDRIARSKPHCALHSHDFHLRAITLKFPLYMKKTSNILLWRSLTSFCHIFKALRGLIYAGSGFSLVKPNVQGYIHRIMM